MVVTPDHGNYHAVSDAEVERALVALPDFKSGVPG